MVLHGALHVFDSGIEIKKYTWSKTGVRLIDQIRDALSKNLFPIFVSEGTSAEKYERIRHNDYLAKAYRSFGSIGGALFIYGHSLAENDDHYLKCIRKGKVSHLYVGLYGAPDSDANKFIARRAAQLSDGRRAKIPWWSPTLMLHRQRSGGDDRRYLFPFGYSNNRCVRQHQTGHLNGTSYETC